MNLEQTISKRNLALTLAYNCVIKLGWTHVRLRNQYGMTYPTLRRIREGKLGKGQTDNFCLQVFLSIINDAYHSDFETTGGDNATHFLRTFREILLAQFGIS